MKFQGRHSTRIPARLLMTVAVLGALVFHGGLSLFGTYRNTYDAYVHIFFADHWRRAWFDQLEDALVHRLSHDFLPAAFAAVSGGAFLSDG